MDPDILAPHEVKWKLIPIDLPITTKTPDPDMNVTIDPRIKCAKPVSMTEIIKYVSIPSPISELPEIDFNLFTEEKSSNYLPVIIPEDTRDWSYVNDPIHKELMEDLFVSDSDDDGEITYEEARILAVEHLESVRTERGNSRA